MKYAARITFLAVILLLGFSSQHLDAKKVKNDTIKILAIGNSFSVDALEDHLPEVMQAEGLTVVLGNMYIGGCPIDKHVKNLREDLPAYRYREFDPKGNMTEIKEYSLEKVFARRDWDYVTVQQSSPNSGLPETYELLPELVNFIRERVSEDTEIMFHQTWAYSPESTHRHYGRYGKDMMTMYKAICDAVQSEVPKSGITSYIPAGTAIQNARTSHLGTDLTRDGYHLSKPVGRYIASCTWLAAILKINPVGNTYQPEGMTKKDCRTAQKAALMAVKKPFTITRIK